MTKAKVSPSRGSKAMTELVEKVARKVCHAVEDSGIKCSEPIDAVWERQSAMKGWWRRVATAAIEAMRPEIEREIADWLDSFKITSRFSITEAYCKTVSAEIACMIRNGEHRSKP
jgi:hypothetical protein